MRWVLEATFRQRREAEGVDGVTWRIVKSPRLNERRQALAPTIEVLSAIPWPFEDGKRYRVEIEEAE